MMLRHAAALGWTDEDMNKQEASPQSPTGMVVSDLISERNAERKEAHLD